MAVKQIPAREEVTCDVCMQVCDGRKVRRHYNAKLIVKMDGLDHQGFAVGDASVSRDVCDTCLGRLQTVINNECGKIRDSQNATTEKP